MQALVGPGGGVVTQTPLWTPLAGGDSGGRWLAGRAGEQKGRTGRGAGQRGGAAGRAGHRAGGLRGAGGDEGQDEAGGEGLEHHGSWWYVGNDCGERVRCNRAVMMARRCGRRGLYARLCPVATLGCWAVKADDNIVFAPWNAAPPVSDGHDGRKELLGDGQSEGGHSCALPIDRPWSSGFLRSETEHSQL
jgi:hypothetical protein